MRRLTAVVLAAGALAIASGDRSAQASPITVEFSGAITSVMDPGTFLDPGIVVGSSFDGTYTIDPADFYRETPTIDGGVAYPLRSAGSIEVSVASSTFSQPIEGISVSDQLAFGPIKGGDRWAPFFRLPDRARGYTFIEVSFADSSGTKLASDDPFVNQELTGWDIADLLVFVVDGYDIAARGNITSLSAVPEPRPALPFFAVALRMGILGLERRRMWIS